MSEILRVINELYSSEDKRGSVWAKRPSQVLIDRIPGLLSGETVLRCRRQSIAVVVDDMVRCCRSVLCYILLAIAVPVPLIARAGFIMALVWVFRLMISVWSWNFTVLAVTDLRVIIREGWLTRLVKPVPLGQIMSATVHQRREWETLLDIGNLTLELLGESDPQFSLIDEPFEFRRLLQYVQDARATLKEQKKHQEVAEWFGEYSRLGEAVG